MRLVDQNLRDMLDDAEECIVEWKWSRRAIALFVLACIGLLVVGVAVVDSDTVTGIAAGSGSIGCVELWRCQKRIWFHRRRVTRYKFLLEQFRANDARVN